MHYTNKRATAEIFYIHSAMWGLLKRFYLAFILDGFPDMIVHNFFHILSRILIARRQSSSTDLNSRETSADAVISNVWSVLDLLPSLWNFINSDIDWEKICLQKFTQLSGIAFFRDMTYSAEVILVMIGSFYK